MTSKQFFYFCILLSISSTIGGIYHDRSDDDKAPAKIDSVTISQLKQYVDSTKTKADNDTLTVWLKRTPAPDLKQSTAWNSSIKSMNSLAEMNQLTFLLFMGAAILGAICLGLYIHSSVIRGYF